MRWHDRAISRHHVGGRDRRIGGELQHAVPVLLQAAGETVAPRSLLSSTGADLWQRICGAGPATRSLIRLTAEVGPEFEDQADDLFTEVRDDESRHDDAVALRVSLDGTMLRMPAEERDGQAMEPGWREAACGVVAPLDSKGAMLTQGTFARRPEPGRTGLKCPISQEVSHGIHPAQAQRPEMGSCRWPGWSHCPGPAHIRAL